MRMVQRLYNFNVSRYMFFLILLLLWSHKHIQYFATYCATCPPVLLGTHLSKQSFGSNNNCPSSLLFGSTRITLASIFATPTNYRLHTVWICILLGDVLHRLVTHDSCRLVPSVASPTYDNKLDRTGCIPARHWGFLKVMVTYVMCFVYSTLRIAIQTPEHPKHT